MTLFRRYAEQRLEHIERIRRRLEESAGHILIDRLSDAAQGCSLESPERSHLDFCNECRDILNILTREHEENFGGTL